jgi:hypothetical protein
MPTETLILEYAGAVNAATVALVIARCRTELRRVLAHSPSDELVTEMARRRLTDAIVRRGPRQERPGG